MSESESAVKREQSAVSEREKKDACIEGVSKVAEPRLMTLDDGAAEIRISLRPLRKYARHCREAIFRFVVVSRQEKTLSSSSPSRPPARRAHTPSPRSPRPASRRLARSAWAAAGRSPRRCPPGRSSPRPPGRTRPPRARQRRTPRPPAPPRVGTRGEGGEAPLVGRLRLGRGRGLLLERRGAARRPRRRLGPTRNVLVDPPRWASSAILRRGPLPPPAL